MKSDNSLPTNPVYWSSRVLNMEEALLDLIVVVIKYDKVSPIRSEELSKLLATWAAKNEYIGELYK